MTIQCEKVQELSQGQGGVECANLTGIQRGVPQGTKKD